MRIGGEAIAKGEEADSRVTLNFGVDSSDFRVVTLKSGKCRHESLRQVCAKCRVLPAKSTRDRRQNAVVIATECHKSKMLPLFRRAEFERFAKTGARPFREKLFLFSKQIC